MKEKYLDGKRDDVVIWQSHDGAVYYSTPNEVFKRMCNSLIEYIDL